MTPRRRILVVPWQETAEGKHPRHLEQMWKLLHDWLNDGLHPIGPRVVPILLGASELRLLSEARPPDPATWLIERVTETVAAAREESWKDAAPYRSEIARHLRAGAIRLVLPGIADLDRAVDATGDGEFLTRAEATAVLDAVKRAGVADVVVVGRGCAGADGAPVVARQRLLKEHGFEEPEWLEAGDGPGRHPLSGHLESLLSGDGLAWQQALPLQSYPGPRELAAANDYLLIDRERDTEPLILPRLPRQFHSIGAPEIADETGLWRYLTGNAATPGLMLLDPEAPAGGWGKTVLLLALAARALRDGRPALYLRLPELITRLPALTREHRNASLMELLVEISDRTLPVAERSARAALLAETGLLLLLDGLNEVTESSLFALSVESIARLVRGQVEGVRAVITCRADSWGEHLRQVVEDAKKTQHSEVPATAQLWKSLDEQRIAPREATLRALTGDEARAHLSKTEQGPALLEALGDGLEALLPHPFSLGLLSVLGADERAELTRRRKEQDDTLFLWDVVEVAIEGLVRRGLTRDPAKRPPGRPLGTRETDSPRAMRYLDGLALAMAEYGGTLPTARAPEVIEEIILHLDKEEIRVKTDTSFAELAQGMPLDDASRVLLYQRVLAGTERNWKSENVADPADILADLKAVSLILVQNAAGDWQMSHDLLRDVFGSRALTHLHHSDPTAAARSLWMLQEQYRRDLDGESLATLLLFNARSIAVNGASKKKKYRRGAARYLPAAFVKAIVDTRFRKPKHARKRANVLADAALILSTHDREWYWRSLTLLLRDPDEYAHWTAARALDDVAPYYATHDPEWWWQALTPLLDDPDDEVRSTAALALGTGAAELATNEPERVWQALTSLFDDPDSGVRGAAAFSLGIAALELAANDSERVWQALTSLLADQNEFVWETAANALSRAATTLSVADPGRVWQVLTTLLSDPDEDVRQSTAFALRIAPPELSATDPERLWQVLTLMLSDSVEYVRYSAGDVLRDAALVLGASDPERVWQALTLLLIDPDVEVRQAATFTLGNAAFAATDPERVWRALTQLLDDSDKEMRWAAARALSDAGAVLGASEPLRVWQLVTLLLSAPDKEVRTATAYALERAAPVLGASDPDRVWQVLKSLLADPVKSVRQSAADVLPKIVLEMGASDSDRVWQELSPLLSDRKVPVRRAAQDGLMVAASVPGSVLRDRVLKVLPTWLDDASTKGTELSSFLEAVSKLAPNVPRAERDKLIDAIRARE